MYCFNMEGWFKNTMCLAKFMSKLVRFALPQNLYNICSVKLNQLLEVSQHLDSVVQSFLDLKVPSPLVAYIFQ